MDEIEAERDRLAGLLHVLMCDMHPTWANTTGRRGGIGGQAITTTCEVIDQYEDWQIYFIGRVHDALGEAFRRDERDGTHRLGEARKWAKALPAETEETDHA